MSACAASVASRVWVIGPGFLGAALAQVCRDAGAEVLTLGLTGADVLGDACEAAVLDGALGLLEPELVFCCAATHGGTVADYRHCYPELVRAVLAATHATCAKLVFCSSISVYGAAAPGVELGEDSACLAAGGRVAQLLEAEKLVLAAGGSVARLAALYATGRCELLRRHLAGEPRLAGDAGRVLHYVHRDDAVSALRVIACAPPGIYNVVADALTLEEAYGLLESLTGVPRSAQQAAPSCRAQGCRRVSAERLCRLGWKPRWSLSRWIAGFGVPHQQGKDPLSTP